MRGLLLDENGDLLVNIVRGADRKITSGLVVGDNTLQCAQLILGAFTGEFKNAPLLGANAKNMINGTPDPFWSGNTKRQLRSALIDVERVIYKKEGINVIIKE